MTAADDFTLADPPVQGSVRMSPTIGKLADALAKAQAEMEGAAKDSTNPHFRSKYADLASLREACRPLSKYGIAHVQLPQAEGARVTVTTILIHSSGEWIASDLGLTAGQNTPQAVGSALTYGRRYGLAAMAGIAPTDETDDDGEAAEPRNAPPSVTSPVTAKAPAKPPKATAPPKFDSWWAGMALVAEDGVAALLEAWQKSGRDLKEHVQAKHSDEWEALKARARAVKRPADAEEAPF